MNLATYDDDVIRYIQQNTTADLTKDELTHILYKVEMKAVDETGDPITEFNLIKDPYGVVCYNDFLQLDVEEPICISGQDQNIIDSVLKELDTSSLNISPNDYTSYVYKNTELFTPIF